MEQAFIIQDERCDRDPMQTLRSVEASREADSPGAESDCIVRHDLTTTTQIYRDMTAKDNSRQHVGNVYNYYHSPVPPAKDTETDAHQKALQKLLVSLAFDQMDNRYDNIAREHPDTCKWIYACPEYQQWQDASLNAAHHGCLWIKGKPGAGKSTIMKSLIRRTEETHPDHVVVPCFFNARGESLERATEGIYRTMVYQVASKVPEIWTKLDDNKLERYKKSGWPLEVLKDLCREAVHHLTSRSKVVCFIDALDEGDVEDDVRDMVVFIEELTGSAFSNDRSLYICLASRHYPAISMRHLVEIFLDRQQGHIEDIAKFVKSRLRLDSEHLRHDLTSTIIQKAKGVFLWVALVVNLLNKVADHGNQHLLREKLEGIPTQLNDLFEQLIGRWDTDARFLPAVLWVLFAQKTLRAVELYYAIMISTQQLTAANIAWDEQTISSKVIRDYILSSSKGFLEVTSFEIPWVNKRHELEAPARFIITSVQFIHESAREFILEHGLRMMDNTLSKDLEAIAHGRLAEWCQNYLRLTIQIGITHEFEQYAAVAPYPLLHYTRAQTLKHSAVAAAKGNRSATYADLSVQEWSYAIGDRFEASDGAPCPTLLHMLMRKDYMSLVNVELERIATLNVEDHRSYIDALCRWTGKSRCPTLCEAICRPFIEVARMLLDNGADANVFCALHGGPLENAVECELTESVELLLEKGANVNAPLNDGWYGSLLYTPILRGMAQIVKLLLEGGANANACCEGDESIILNHAVECGTAEITGILLRHGANPNIRQDRVELMNPRLDVQYRDTALNLAVKFHDSKQVSLLLHHGANVNACDADGWSALEIATSTENQEVIELLRKFGAREGKGTRRTAKEIRTKLGNNWESLRPNKARYFASPRISPARRQTLPP